MHINLVKLSVLAFGPSNPTNESVILNLDVSVYSSAGITKVQSKLPEVTKYNLKSKLQLGSIVKNRVYPRPFERSAMCICT